MKNEKTKNRKPKNPFKRGSREARAYPISDKGD